MRPPCSGHAVHRRRHAVLAHAVVDVAAGVVAGASTSVMALGLGVVRRRSGRPSRRPVSGTRRRSALEHRAARPCGSRASAFSATKLVAELRRSAASKARRAARPACGARTRPRSAGELASRLSQARARRRAARAGLAPGRADVVGHHEGRRRASRAARARRRSPRRRAASRAPPRCRPWSARRSRSSSGRRSASAGRRSAPGAMRAAIASVVVAVDPFGRPAMRLEARDLVVGDGEVGRAVDRDANCRPRSTISLLSLRWPASEIASWLMPSIRQPSPAMT